MGSVDLQVLSGKRRPRPLRAVRRDWSDGGRRAVEEGVLQGGGRLREAPPPAVAMETQRRVLPAVRDPAESERGGAESAGAGRSDSRYSQAPPRSERFCSYLCFTSALPTRPELPERGSAHCWSSLPVLTVIWAQQDPVLLLLPVTVKAEGAEPTDTPPFPARVLLFLS